MHPTIANMLASRTGLHYLRQCTKTSRPQRGVPSEVLGQAHHLRWYRRSCWPINDQHEVRLIPSQGSHELHSSSFTKSSSGGSVVMRAPLPKLLRGRSFSGQAGRITVSVGLPDDTEKVISHRMCCTAACFRHVPHIMHVRATVHEAVQMNTLWIQAWALVSTSWMRNIAQVSCGYSQMYPARSHMALQCTSMQCYVCTRNQHDHTMII